MIGGVWGGQMQMYHMQFSASVIKVTYAPYIPSKAWLSKFEIGSKKGISIHSFYLFSCPLSSETKGPALTKS